MLMIVNNVKTISVTELVDLFKPKFDKELWSSIKALQELLSKVEFNTVRSQLYNQSVFNIKILDRFDIDKKLFEETKKKILDSWELANTIACEKGEHLHKLMEEKYVDNAMMQSPLNNSEGSFLCITNGSLESGQKAIYPEFSINYVSPDNNFAIVGRADLVTIDDIYVDIQDYKTCKEIKKTGYFNQFTKSKKKMKYPLSNLDDCNFNHYALQLSLYAWMIEKKNPEVKIRSLTINHVKDKGNEIIEVPYLKKDIQALIEEYDYALKIQKQYDKLKPIKY